MNNQVRRGPQTPLRVSSWLLYLFIKTLTVVFRINFKVLNMNGGDRNYWLSGGWVTRDWMRKSCWQKETALINELFKCRPVSELKHSQAACGGWFPTLVPGLFRPFGSALRLRGAWLASGLGCRATTGRFMVWPRMMMRFWNSASVAVHATLRRDDAAMVFHACFISGGCVNLNFLSALNVCPFYQIAT
jgi:hypothetical protein